MKRDDRPPLTPKLEAELAALVGREPTAADLEAMPPVTDWSGFVRGKYHKIAAALEGEEERPIDRVPKRQVG